MGFESGFGLGMGLGLRHEVRQQLRVEQKQSLRQLLELRLALKHEGFLGAAVGIEGMRTANDLLTDRRLRGLLIGGLSEAVWNPRHTRKNLDAHKDVDVLVVEPSDTGEINQLEAGIDWWMPREEFMKVYHQGVDSTEEGQRRFWENAFGVRLAFGVKINYFSNFPPGLYLPEPDFVVAMRKAEAFARIDTKKFAVDDEVEASFTEKLEKTIKQERAPVVKKVKEWDEGFSVPEYALDDFGHEVYMAVLSAGK